MVDPQVTIGFNAKMVTLDDLGMPLWDLHIPIQLVLSCFIERYMLESSLFDLHWFVIYMHIVTM